MSKLRYWNFVKSTSLSKVLSMKAHPNRILMLQKFKKLIRNDSLAFLYVNRCVARVCCKSARHWLTAAPYSTSAHITDGCDISRRDIWQLLRFSRSIARCVWHCYRLHYLRRPAQYIISVKPAWSEVQFTYVVETGGVTTVTITIISM